MPRPRRTRAEQLPLIELAHPPHRSASVPGRRGARGAPSRNPESSEFGTGLDVVAADLVGDCDPVTAELQGAMFACLARFATGGDERFVPVLAAALAEQPTPAALALALAMRATADPAVRPAFDAVVTRLVEAGMPVPPWTHVLAEPITAGEFWRLTSPEGEASVLVGSFQRAGSTHVVVVSVDGLACGEASMIGVVAPEDLAVLDDVMPGAVRESLDPAQFRWEVESALRIRHDHDIEVGGPDPEDEEAVEYGAGEALLRARLAALPALDRPLREHPEPAEVDDLDLSEFLPVPRPRSAGRASKAVRGKTSPKATTAPKGRPTPRRGARKAASNAAIYQVKVTLRGSRPPIWRRLEVPADITLYELHRVLQVAFEWDDMHLHLFETPVGRFGRADPELGLRADKRVTLAEVAPEVKSKIMYEYDFGDSWEHEIVVEKILDREPTVDYPRCTGGRRAAPPEDCGGVWGYANLVEALADPSHPDHEDLVDWLGLDSGDEFDPERFDAAEINRHLAALR